MRNIKIEEVVPTLESLNAALHEVDYTGNTTYELNGKLPFLKELKAEALASIEAAMRDSPQVRLFLSSVAVARRFRLDAERLRCRR